MLTEGDWRIDCTIREMRKEGRHRGGAVKGEGRWCSVYEIEVLLERDGYLDCRMWRRIEWMMPVMAERQADPVDQGVTLQMQTGQKGPGI